ncbi:hypothetical protein P4193_00745 [Pseudomonas aeruginosa]|nr:hypothetical protein [Pseudomonas aeruginosa]
MKPHFAALVELQSGSGVGRIIEEKAPAVPGDDLDQLVGVLQTFLLAHLVSSLGIGQLEPISSRRTWCANSIQWRIGYASCRRVQVKWKGWSSSPGMKAIDKGEIDREGRRKGKPTPGGVGLEASQLHPDGAGPEELHPGNPAQQPGASSLRSALRSIHRFLFIDSKEMQARFRLGIESPGLWFSAASRSALQA